MTSRPADGASDRKNPGLHRALVTSSVGSALECYDFAIYGTASALVFRHLFFPGLGPAVGSSPSSPPTRSASSPARSAGSSSARSETDTVVRPCWW
ncbi:hypothetical protein OG920_44900 [Streptomyces europaeiscabiei]|uniref:hypothetical protein n=1 Tax=Streptomyces europaeiscabiei TaxID=146819 RepID=UPI002E19D7A4